MNPVRPVNPIRDRIRLIPATFLLAMTAMAGGLAAQSNYDARIDHNRGFLAGPSDQQRQALDALRGVTDGLSAAVDRATGVTRTLSSPRGYLTQANPGADAGSIGLSFVRQNAAALGLTARDLDSFEILDRVHSAASGATRLYLRQIHDGRPVYNGLLQLNVNRDGHLISVANGFVGDLAAGVNVREPNLTGPQAVDEAARHLGLAASDLAPSAPVLMWLPIRRGETRLVWNFNSATPDGRHYDFTVDAITGRVWTRFDWVSDADYRVYQAPVESPVHTSPTPPSDARTLQVDPQNATASPLGWHDTGSTSYTITRGNNAHAYPDRDGNNSPDFNVDCGVSLSCDFTIDLTSNPPAYIDAAVANLFYWNNYIHDTQYLYGFDEASGNFQVNNFGNGGAGNDDVRAEAQDNDLGGSNCNANFFTPADGSRPRMQMFTCANASPERDGDLDNGVIVHEYAHGISNRLVGGPSSVNCLGNLQQAGEGWSDLFALIYTHQAGFQDTDARGVGSYLFDLAPVGGTIRTFPYSTDFGVNPDTYSSIAGRSVPHGVGSVWAEIAWETYWEVVNTRGFDPDLQNTAADAGNQRAMFYFTEGLKNTACSPTFIDARDGVIQAAIDNRVEDVCPLWRGFGRRGLGLDAFTSSPNSLTATDGFMIPAQCDENPSCGDGVCEFGEDCNTCPADCSSGGSASCGNGVCEAGDGEDCVNCPSDCNGVQKGNPNNRFCCGFGGQNPVGCANAACTSGGFQCTETPSTGGTCCGDFLCEGSETSAFCAIDCPSMGGPSCAPAGDSCTTDSQCCSNKCRGPSGRMTCR